MHRFRNVADRPTQPEPLLVGSNFADINGASIKKEQQVAKSKQQIDFVSRYVCNKRVDRDMTRYPVSSLETPQCNFMKYENYCCDVSVLIKNRYLIYSLTFIDRFVKIF